MNLMLDAVNLKESYSALIEAAIKTHHDAIKKIVSSYSTPEIMDEEDYAERLCERLFKLKSHSFSSQQSS